MFQALLADPQEVLQKRHLVYCECVMSVGRTRIEVELLNFSTATATWHNTHTIYQLLLV
jgi:hypothetical protein